MPGRTITLVPGREIYKSLVDSYDKSRVKLITIEELNLIYVLKGMVKPGRFMGSQLLPGD